MKKNRLLYLVIIIVLSCAFLITSCATPNSEPEKTSDAPEETATPEITQSPEDEYESYLKGLSALELVEIMGNGTNLGNTMESYGHKTEGIDKEVSHYETLWGQPITTPEMLLEIKKAGFDSIRIPVAWTNKMDYENGDYTISQDYIDRVTEIVDYALDADMFVIFNDHWDGGWWGMFGSATPETRENAMQLYISMWAQLAQHFKDYSYKLIFEGANEELGSRLNDIDIASDSGTLSEDECYVMNNKLNQVFVDTVRSTGGKNADRFLLVSGYNTDIKMTCDERFILPTDTTEDKLLLSVHYYTPWSYCGTSGVSTWGTEKHLNTMNDLLSMMTKYTDQGYGIIFGEYAVLKKSNGELKTNTIDYIQNFLDNCDLYGYVPMLWDTNSFFIREDLKMVDDDLGELFLDRSLLAQSDMSLDEVKQAARASLASSLEVAIENDKNYEGPALSGDEDAVAWIMFNSQDYNVTYSVGDLYDPTLKTEGVVATDALIEEAGTYTVSLDFTGTDAGYAQSTAFSALGISNGELLFPEYLITIKEILINGEPYELKGIPYTTADDEICTRVNLYNGWVNEIPPEARCANERMRPGLSATIIDQQELDQIKTISVTFEYAPIN